MPVLGCVRERLGDDVIRGDLDPLGQAAIRPDVKIDRHSGVAGQRAQRGAESALGQDRGVNTPREVAQLVHRTGQLVDGAIELCASSGDRVAPPPAPRATERRP
jgi:hypothetical protein